MKKDKFEIGLKNLKAVEGHDGYELKKIFDGIAPGLAEYLIEFIFGDVYEREGLTFQERETVAITSLLTLGGCDKELRTHIISALNVGISKEKIVEIFIQCIPFAGFPRALNAIFILQEILESDEYKNKSLKL